MQSPEPIRILQVTDLHLRAAPDGELYGVRTNGSFQAVMERALGDDDWHPAAIMVTGDLAEDPSREVYTRFRSAMESFGPPVLCLPGNHDDPSLMAAVLDGGLVSYCTSHTFGSWRVVPLDTVVPGEDGGALSDRELTRLQREISADETQWVIVAVHHQPLPMGSAWLDGVRLGNGPEMLSLLARHRRVRAVVWGHVHQASDRRRGELRLLSTPSTCAQFMPGTTTCVMDSRPPGFRRLDLGHDGSIHTEVVWLDGWPQTAGATDSRAICRPPR